MLLLCLIRSFSCVMALYLKILHTNFMKIVGKHHCFNIFNTIFQSYSVEHKISKASAYTSKLSKILIIIVQMLDIY